MLYVRYSALFPVVRTQSYCVELLLSLLSLEQRVARYLDLCVVIYTLADFKQGFLNLCTHFDFPTRVIALDEEYASLYKCWNDFASTIRQKMQVDQLCIIRMLADFHILPPSEHRLLTGCDIFFLDVPQELLRFVWKEKKKKKVLYLQDVFSSAGVPYRLRYYPHPILEGLVGDFYCLAPGVHLEEADIRNCLTMIDTWPTSPGRYDPLSCIEETGTCEQQATAILLQPWGGKPLPLDRYAHFYQNQTLAVFHGHATQFVASRLDAGLMTRSHQIVEQCM